MTVRAYLRYSPRTFYDKAVVDRYPTGAFAAFSAVLCLAEEQPEPTGQAVVVVEHVRELRIVDDPVVHPDVGV